MLLEGVSLQDVNLRAPRSACRALWDGVASPLFAPRPFGFIVVASIGRARLTEQVLDQALDPRLELRPRGLHVVPRTANGFARPKAALFSGIMDDGELFATSLTAEDIRGLVE